MSMKTKLNKVDKNLKRKIVALMYQNGVDRESVTYLLKNGTLSDIADYIDIEDLIVA